MGHNMHPSLYYFLPSTMIMWYPNCVLTSDDRTGLSTVDGWSAKAASWNAPYTVSMVRYSSASLRKYERRGRGRTTIDPRTIQPKLPPAGEEGKNINEGRNRLVASHTSTFRLVLGVLLCDPVETLALLHACKGVGAPSMSGPKWTMGRGWRERTWIFWRASRALDCFSHRM